MTERPPVSHFTEEVEAPEPSKAESREYLSGFFDYVVKYFAEKEATVSDSEDTEGEDANEDKNTEDEEEVKLDEPLFVVIGEPENEQVIEVVIEVSKIQIGETTDTRVRLNIFLPPEEENEQSETSAPDETAVRVLVIDKNGVVTNEYPTKKTESEKFAEESALYKGYPTRTLAHAIVDQIIGTYEILEPPDPSLRKMLRRFHDIVSVGLPEGTAPKEDGTEFRFPIDIDGHVFDAILYGLKKDKSNRMVVGLFEGGSDTLLKTLYITEAGRVMIEDSQVGISQADSDVLDEILPEDIAGHIAHQTMLAMQKLSSVERQQMRGAYPNKKFSSLKSSLGMRKESQLSTVERNHIIDFYKRMAAVHIEPHTDESTPLYPSAEDAYPVIISGNAYSAFYRGMQKNGTIIIMILNEETGGSALLGVSPTGLIYGEDDEKYSLGLDLDDMTNEEIGYQVIQQMEEYKRINVH